MSASAIKIQVIDEDNEGQPVKKKTSKKTVVKTGKTVSSTGPKAAAAKKAPVSTLKTKNKKEQEQKAVSVEIEKAEKKGKISESEKIESKELKTPIIPLIKEDEEKTEKSILSGFDEKTKFNESSEEKESNKGDRVKNMIAELNIESESEAASDSDEPEEDFSEISLHAARSLGIYRKIAYFFIFLVIVLLAFVFYYSFVKVTIVLIPNQERVSNNMIFDIIDRDLDSTESGNAVIGVVREIEIGIEKDFPASGAEVIGKEVSGIAVIYNNYSKNQPLVASTRLLSPDNKLFRIKNTVNVPAGSSVEVEIYADQPSAEMAVPAKTKFSIPGLWAGLQDQIYAENIESLDYKQKVKKYIVSGDIDDSARELKQLLLSKAKAEVNETYKEYSEIIYKIDDNSVKSETDKKVGTETETFNYSMTAKVVVVAFDGDKSEQLARQKFVSSLSESKELINFDSKNIVYVLNNFDTEKGNANINATFEGRISIKNNFDVVETDKILGLNNEQLEVYLKSLNEIAGYEIRYVPSFIKKVPNLVDRINIEIKK